SLSLFYLHVLPSPTRRSSDLTTYVWLADRWNNDQLADSRYIWLPIQFEGDELFVRYYDKWELDVATGEWKATCLLSQDFEGVLRSEEHTSELQSRENIVCRLL